MRVSNPMLETQPGSIARSRGRVEEALRRRRNTALLKVPAPLGLKVPAPLGAKRFEQSRKTTLVLLDVLR